jgi:hypothetical protein
VKPAQGEVQMMTSSQEDIIYIILIQCSEHINLILKFKTQLHNSENENVWRILKYLHKSEQDRWGIARS